MNDDQRLPPEEMAKLEQMVNAVMGVAPSMDRRAPNVPVKDCHGQPYAYDKNGTIHRLFDKPKSRKRDRAAR